MPKIKAELIGAGEINNGVRLHLSVAEAAKRLGVSESAIRYSARRLGVIRFSGKSVRGGVLIRSAPADIVITYSH